MNKTNKQYHPRDTAIPLPRRARLALYGLLAVWVLVCFGFALRLPFFWDDLPIMTWLQDRSWQAILFTTENAYYRPLAFAIYKLATYLPLPLQAPTLHAANLFLLWAGAVLLFAIVHLSQQPRSFDRRPSAPGQAKANHASHDASAGGTRLQEGVLERHRAQALITALLFVAFPFMSESIPWITALSHPLVTALTLLATYAALRAAKQGDRRFWLLSLAATGLAPLAHESGAVAGLIVAGIVLIEQGLRCRGRCLAYLAGGIALDVLLVAGRALIPGAHTGTALNGLPDLIPNIVYTIQGALYPLGPLLGFLVLDRGAHDFTVILLFAALLLLLILLLWRYSGRWRWAAGAIWWTAVAALPVIVSIDYNGLFVSARLYTLPAVGSAILWGGLVVSLGNLAARLTRREGSRRLLWGILTLLVLIPSLFYIRRYRNLYDMLDGLYQEVTTVVEEAEGPPGFVNLPAALTREERVYPLVTEHVVFLNDAISDLNQYLQVNVGSATAARAAVYAPLFQETDPFWISQGPWLEGEAMRQFLVDHDTVWLARFDEATGQFGLRLAGSLAPADAAASSSVARFEEGTVLQGATWEESGDGRYTITLDWRPAGPVGATTFLHVRDAAGAVVTQADGPSMSGLLPLHLWRAGDRVVDMRHVTIPAGAAGPFTVQVGLYNETGRLGAYATTPAGETRAPEDAVTVTTIPDR